MKIKANFDHIPWNGYNMLLYVSYYEIVMCYYILILWNGYMLSYV